MHSILDIDFYSPFLYTILNRCTLENPYMGERWRRGLYE